VYAADQSTLVDTIYCGTANKATTKELPLGVYYVKEQAPPAGYTLDTAMHKVTIAYGSQDVEVVMVDGEVKNKVIEGQIALVKHLDKPMEGYDAPQIEQPLEGAVFEVFLKSAGSYAAAKETERDRLTTNSDGYAISKKLPYGIYTVVEVDAPGDVKLVEPFDVFITTEGRIYRFILNDPAYTARVKVVKLDAGTGKVIPAAGTSFKIKNLKTGEWVKQNVWYPAPATINVVETGMDGTLMLPEPLKSGTYELHEVKAPYGYLVSDKPLKFSISSAQQQAVVTVEMKNAPVMGKLTVEKQGEMLVGVEEVDTQWGKQLVPVFGMRGLVGAEFDIIAGEDIITLDGTVRAKKGDVVDHIVTGANGTATSKALFLGNYLAVETKAPTGFVLDTEKHPVSLVYADQNTAIVSSQIGVDNVRQAVEITLNKVMEKPVGAPEDFSAFADVVFGLFAGEDIGGIIPKDALIATITLDDNGKGVFSGDLPFGKFYVRELQTSPFYQLNDTIYPIDAAYAGQDKAVSKVQVNNGGTIPNELKMGKLVIEKKGEVLVGASRTADGYTPVYELRGLKGAIFDIVTAEDIYDVSGKLLLKKGTVVDTVTTGGDGKAESITLRLGSYEVVETAAPAGFVLDPTRHAVTLGFDGQTEEVLTTQVTVLNERQRVEINVKKSWELPASLPKDFVPWKDITFGLYAKADILAADGSVATPAGALIETIAIDKDGKGKAMTDLPYGAYYLQETRTAKGYALDDTKHVITFSPGEKATATFSVSAENKLQRGSLRIIKSFEGRKESLEGVPFLVVGQTAFGEVRFEAKTDKNGEIVLKDLPVGSYTVAEQKSELTASYILAPAQIVSVTAGNETVLRIVNQLAKGEIRVLKIDKETGKPLAGAMFGLYRDGKLIAEAQSGKDGYAIFKDVAFGGYEIRELSAPVGYNRSEEALKAIVGKDGSVVLLEVTNERIPGEPVQPEEPERPVGPQAPLPKTGDSNTIIVIALAVLILAGGVVLWLRKRGKDEDEATATEDENT
jgi:LPXTG-motif cell wall-anchored protein